jgi:acetolactate decarboxylase
MPIDEPFIRAFRAHRPAGGPFHTDARRAHEIFQSSTLSALLEGVYDGDMTYGELARHGNFGLGTFNALDGEMIALEGRFYQVKSDGKAYPVDPSLRTPFAVVMFFDPTVELSLEQPTTYSELQDGADRAVPSTNLFYAVRAEGFFEYLKVRSVPRQSPPYPPMTEVVKHQPIFELGNVRGTLAGFRFPDYTQGINVPGYHLHFLTEDRTAGGHVLDFRMHDARVAIDVTSDLHMEMPERGDFLKAELAKDNAEAIHQAEK